MQDYARLFPSKIRLSKPTGRLTQIRKLLLSGLPPEIIVPLIAAVVLPASISLIRK